MQKRVENLVICSTLNQITNYLMIKKYNPKRVFNITFDEDAKKRMHLSINNEKWDNQLARKVINKNKFENNIEISSSDIYSLVNIKDRLEKSILDVAKNEEIYWHITGGQRTIALAINELVKERENDKVIYIEGNTETLIVNDYKGELISSESVDYNYGNKDLTFLDILNLVGFEYKSQELEHTKIFKENGQKKIEENDKEYEFYKKLYYVIYSQKEKEIEIIYNDILYKDTFRNLLLKSNTISNKEKDRKEFINLVFKKLLVIYNELGECGYYKKDTKEFDNSYPAGYIFEKITAYKIYDLIRDCPKIVGMETSLKTYFTDKEKSNHNIDELDIVLLTDTGKIINFECKSGGMKGDNAKSHNYTTYRLSGVFGMPILLSPLYDEEIRKDFKDNNEELKNQLQALRAAKAAELEVFTIDRIEEGLGKLRIIG